MEPYDVRADISQRSKWRRPGWGRWNCRHGIANRLSPTRETPYRARTPPKKLSDEIKRSSGGWARRNAGWHSVTVLQHDSTKRLQRFNILLLSHDSAAML